MVFSSIFFLWVFLPFSLCGYHLLNKKYQNTFLLIISLLFYSWGEPQSIIILLSSIIANYFLALLMDKSGKFRKPLFITIICLNVFILFYYKYLSFILSEIIGYDKITNNIPLPIGISFYTFSILSYIIEVYRKNTAAIKNITHLGLYITFFPKITQGPIVKYTDFIPQLSDRTITINKFYTGIVRFILGLGKKLLIANILGGMVDEIFQLSPNQLSTSTAWLGAAGYTLQIYYDFSGYSDMAIGLALMFGFNIKENFNYPYLSTSIKDFWKRWHISLNVWFRDYIYIPLGGNKKGKKRTYINTIVVFLITGIWHGANWTFLFWGLYHGIIQIMESALWGNYLKKFKITSLIYTNLIVLTGWVLFRADNIKHALIFIKNMFIYQAELPNFKVSNFINNKIIVVLIIGIIFSGFIQNIFFKVNNHLKVPEVLSEILKIIFLIGIIFLCLMSLAVGSYNTFIYFKF